MGAYVILKGASIFRDTTARLKNSDIAYDNMDQLKESCRNKPFVPEESVIFESQTGKQLEVFGTSTGKEQPFSALENESAENRACSRRSLCVLNSQQGNRIDKSQSDGTCFNEELQRKLEPQSDDQSGIDDLQFKILQLQQQVDI